MFLHCDSHEVLGGVFDLGVLKMLIYKGTHFRPTYLSSVLRVFLRCCSRQRRVVIYMVVVLIEVPLASLIYYLLMITSFFFLMPLNKNVARCIPFWVSMRRYQAR